MFVWWAGVGGMEERRRWGWEGWEEEGPGGRCGAEGRAAGKGARRSGGRCGCGARSGKRQVRGEGASAAGLVRGGRLGGGKCGVEERVPRGGCGCEAEGRSAADLG